MYINRYRVLLLKEDYSCLRNKLLVLVSIDLEILLVCFFGRVYEFLYKLENIIYV